MRLASLILLRHGESEGNKANDLALNNTPHKNEAKLREMHTSDRRLSVKGLAEAGRAGDWLRAHWFRPDAEDDFAFYTSPYVRAMETAGALKFGNDWRLDDRLVELDLGDLEHVSYAERMQLRRELRARPGRHVIYWRPPHGESFFDVCNRTRQMMAELDRRCHDKNVLLVGHGDAMTAWRAVVEHWSPQVFSEHLRTRGDRRGRVINCRIIQYDRLGENGSGRDSLNRVRLIDPGNPNNVDTNIDWHPIQTSVFSHRDLARYTATFPRALVD